VACKGAIALTFYLGFACYCEHKWRLIPNWLTLPGMVLALGWRAGKGCCCGHPTEGCITGMVTILIIWVGIYMGWLLHFYGAGDAKLLMGLFALFPEIEFLWALAGSIVLVGGAMLLSKYRGRMKELRGFYLSNLLALRLHPCLEEMESASDPLTFPIAIAGVVYAWILD